MSTTADHVIALRPRALARRAGAQRELLVARRRRVAPGHQQPLRIVTDVLGRSGRVAAVDLDSWERLLDLCDGLVEHEEPATLARTAVIANLVALALFDDVDDIETLADLADLLGHQRLARLQHRLGSTWERHPGLPVTTRAIRWLLANGFTEPAALLGAHALLTQGLDHRWAVPLLEAPEEVLDIVRHGTVVEWRHHAALVAADPWSSYAERLVALGRATGEPAVDAVVSGLIDLSRDQISGRRPTRSRHGGPRAVGGTGAPAGVPARHLGGVTQHG